MTPSVRSARRGAPRARDAREMRVARGQAAVCRGGGARGAVRLRGAGPRRRRGAGRRAGRRPGDPLPRRHQGERGRLRSTSPRTSPGTSRRARNGTASSATSRCGSATRTARTPTASTRCRDVSATSPSGAPADVSVTDATDGSSMRIRVGRADETVSGTQTYVVRYHLGRLRQRLHRPRRGLLQPGRRGRRQRLRERQRDRHRAGSERPRRVLHRRVRVDRSAARPPRARAPSSARRRRATVRASRSWRRCPSTGSARSTRCCTRARCRTTAASSAPPPPRRSARSRSGAGVTLPLLAAGLMGTLVYTRGRDEQYAGLTPGSAPVVGEDGQVVRGRTRSGRGAVHPTGGRPAGAGRHGHRRDGQHHRRLRHHHRPRGPRPPHHRRGGRRLPARARTGA